MLNRKPEKKRQRALHNTYLGVDGGGTKTHAILYDEERNVIGEGFAGASNPLRVGVEPAVNNIFQAMTAASEAANRSRGDIAAAVFGLAGVRRVDLRQRVRERLAQKLGIKTVEVVTDAEIALFGTTLGKAGVVVIAGTGSICLGRNEAGATAIAGGWGPLAGDEGGGAGIARRALQAIAKASDGRGRLTKLSEAGTLYFRAATPENLLTAIYSPQMDNARIAGFAKFVVEAAQARDEIALEILEEAGAELGTAVNAVVTKLKLNRRKIPIGTVGSIFRAGVLLTEPLLTTIHRTAPRAFLSPPVLQPANAAAQMAFEMYQKQQSGTSKVSQNKIA